MDNYVLHNFLKKTAKVGRLSPEDGESGMEKAMPKKFR
jgi:hypothetical protein